MKSEKQIIRLHRMIILVILICVVATSISLTPDSQNQMKEHHTGEVLLVIDEWLNEFISADESGRLYKLNAYMALSDFQTQRSNHALQCERIDSEFNDALSHIVDWFYNNYASMIDEIAKEAAGNNAETEQYLSELSADIDKFSDFFASTDDAQVVNRAYRAELFAELNDMNTIAPRMTNHPKKNIPMYLCIFCGSAIIKYKAPRSKITERLNNAMNKK